MQFFVLGSFVQACCWTLKRLPQAGETFIASGLTIEAGGKGLNVAICTRRLGANVDIALGIGNDAAGTGLLDLLKAEDVGASNVHRLGLQSGYGAGLIGSDGQNAIAVYPGPNLLLNAQHMFKAEVAIKSADLVYGQFETSVDAIQQAFSIANKNGVTTILNPSPWQTVAPDLLKITDVLIVNEVEACGLFQIATIDFSLSIEAVVKQLEVAINTYYKHWMGKLIIVTLGQHGSAAFSPSGQSVYCLAYNIKALDTVGAGDAFASGFCMAYMQNKSIAEALQIGNACGAIVASQFGVLDTLPTATSLAAFITAHSKLS
jgi:ribokinase